MTQANCFKEANAEELKKCFYDEAVQLRNFLKDTDFFLVYPSHFEKKNNIVKILHTYYDRTQGAIEVSMSLFGLKFK